MAHYSSMEEQGKQKKKFGFYCHYLNTFFFCDTEEEFEQMQALARETESEMEQEQLEPIHEIFEANDPWEPLFEIFNDDRLNRSYPDPTLQLIT